VTESTAGAIEPSRDAGSPGAVEPSREGESSGAAEPSVAVVGYASLDRAMAVTSVPGPAGTSLVRERLSRPWPAPGGLAYPAAAIAAAGMPVEAISWVGRDADGAGYLAQLRRAGIGVRGIAAVGARTPSSYLFYAPGGETVCVYDPGDGRPGGLTGEQREVLTAAAWACLTVAPRWVTEEALEALAAGTRLAWTVKADPDAYPASLVRRLLGRAAAVTFSVAERGFLQDAVAPRTLPAAAAPDALLVETDGAAPVRFWSGGMPGMRECPPLTGEANGAVPPDAGADTTGAGDTFAGGLVASLVRAPGDPAGAVEAAIAAAARLLRHRFAARRPQANPPAYRTGMVGEP
jgi:ribokinase